MEITNRTVVEECLERIELWQEHYRAVNAALYRAREKYAHRGGEVDSGNLLHEIMQQELDEWRGLFLWTITLDDAERDRIKAAAHRRFLADGLHVAHWFHDGVSPGQWLCSDEEEFRAMARAAFGPKGGTDAR